MVLPPLSQISPLEHEKGIVNRNKTKSQNPAQLLDIVNTQEQAAQLRSRRQRTHIAKLELQVSQIQAYTIQLERTQME